MNPPNKTLSAIEVARLRLQALKQKEQAEKTEMEQKVLGNRTLEVPSLVNHGWIYDDSRPWNERQLQAINAGLAGKSFVVIGAAGTGKTSVQKGIVYSMLKNNLLPPIPAGKDTKYLKIGVPGIVVTSFTNMAVKQSAKNFSGDITCVTIHKLLEFAPVYYEVEQDDGSITKKMVFEPQRNKMNPLPRELKTILIDESSMVDTSLFQLLWDALPNPHAVQFIFFGDLNQLPPVYGGPILGKKLLELPIVELTEVYRQALLSPIITVAHQMKNGKPIPVTEKLVTDAKEHGQLIIHPWSARLKWEDALNKAENHMKAALRAELYNPISDMILCPYNVNFGVLELNNAIADFLGRERGAEVIEVVAGFEKKYLAVGDKLLVQKQEAIITKIQRNSKYAGKAPLDPKKFTITRWGGATKKKNGDDLQDVAAGTVFDDPDFDVDDYLDALANSEVKDRKNASSHIVEVRFITPEEKLAGKLEENVDDDEEEFDHRLETSAALNECLFGYALTVHKSQGSEWRRVFGLTHHSHAKMCSRELMYTMMTRARDFLYMIVEPDRVQVAGTLSSAARKPRLKGDTLAEKLVSLKERFDREAKEEASKKAKEDEDE